MGDTPLGELRAAPSPLDALKDELFRHPSLSGLEGRAPSTAGGKEHDEQTLAKSFALYQPSVRSWISQKPSLDAHTKMDKSGYASFKYEAMSCYRETSRLLNLTLTTIAS